MNPRPLIAGLMLAVMALIMAGCATTSDNDQISEVPWNKPQSWEGPFPSTINQGR